MVHLKFSDQQEDTQTFGDRNEPTISLVVGDSYEAKVVSHVPVANPRKINKSEDTVDSVIDLAISDDIIPLSGS